jgi:hypothetical protein
MQTAPGPGSIRSACVAIRSRTPLPITGAPVARKRAEAVWTGSEMIVWGGENGSQNASFNSGGHYDPLTDTWEATSLTGAPEGRAFFSSFWTGSEMLVWGGFRRGTGQVDSGGLYNPVTRTWRPTSLNGAPASRRNAFAAAWTGEAMIVFGGFSGFDPIGNGAIYHQDANIWEPLPPNGSPSPRHRNHGVWTGSEFIIWGGNDGPEYHSDAHRLRP